MSETIEVSVSYTITIRGSFSNVKQLEQKILTESLQVAQSTYATALKQYQQRWLDSRRDRYTAQRWRTCEWVTPLGTVEIPNLVIRERDRDHGGYHSVLKLLGRGKATRLLSPAVELRALEMATAQNYRPAAAMLGQYCESRVSHWSVWQCVQHYGRRLQEQLGRSWWPDPPLGLRPSVVVTEIDSTMLKRQWCGQRRGRSRHFEMHLGLHYVGRKRRWQRHGSRSVKLDQKQWLVGAENLGVFGRRLRQQRDRHYGSRPELGVLLSDGHEGLRWVQEREFENDVWLLDRWHISQRVREWVGPDQNAYWAIMKPVYASDSEAALEQLRAQEPPAKSPAYETFRKLFGYLLGGREGIDGYKQIPARWRRSHGRQAPVVRAGSGAVEKNLEVKVNRRFKRQGRSWNPGRADRLAQLLWLQQQPQAWSHWWDQVCLATTKVKPGWAPN